MGSVNVSGLGSHGDGSGGCASGPALCLPPPVGAASRALSLPGGLASGAASGSLQDGVGDFSPPAPVQEGSWFQVRGCTCSHCVPP